MKSDVEALVALVLLGAALPALVLAWRSALQTLPARSPARRVMLVATALGGLLRALVPHGIATIYIGYLLTEQALELSPASHYGLGSQALYHALFALLPHDHASLLAVNAVLGTLTLPLSAALAARLHGDPRAGAAMAAMAAMTPLLVRNDTSDANNVPVLLFLVGGLVLLADHLEREDGMRLAGAATLLSLAAISRPEMPLLVPPIVVVCTWAMPRRRPLREVLGARTTWVCLAAFVVAVLPHASHVAESADVLSRRGSLPGAARGAAWSYLGVLASKNALLTPTLYPAGLLALAVAGLARGPSRRTRSALALLSVVSLLPYLLDLCRANMARVQVPAALFCTLLAAGGFVWLLDRGRAFAAIAAGVTMLSAAPTARRLWAPTNEAAEESFLRRSLAALPAGRLTLVRFDRADRAVDRPGSDFTHHHFPDYLVRPPVREGRPSSIRDFVDDPDLDAPAYFFHGMRCYAEFRDEGTPPPRGDALQPACAKMHERFVLEPVVTWDAPNRGDVWLEYYGDAPTLRLGLYRVVGVRAAR